MNLRNIRSIAVYCGASKGNNPIYIEQAERLGNILADQNITLVYGGGNVGMMKAVADGVLAHQGNVIGVIPKDLANLELQHPDISQCYVTDSMQERKFLMRSLSDACIALPGGWGTLEELTEFATLSQLNYHDKAVGLLNINGYFDGLLQFFTQAQEEGFVHASHKNLVVVETDPIQLLEKLQLQKFASIQEQVNDLQQKSNLTSN